jgi:transposase
LTTLVHDGWAPYLRFWPAGHQSCLARLLRRGGELPGAATRGAVRFPRRVKALLQEGLAVRDAGRLSAWRAAAGAADFDGRMHALLLPVKTHPPNERFAAHLWNSRRHLFTFLRHKEVDATNWRAEQAIRPAAVNRKVWGGNRTWAGARAQSVLMSVLRTAQLRGTDSMRFLSRLLWAPADRRPLLAQA